ncbi:hypothetical protein D3C87_1752970 [compost metagenome]
MFAQIERGGGGQPQLEREGAQGIALARFALDNQPFLDELLQEAMHRRVRQPRGFGQFRQRQAPPPRRGHQLEQLDGALDDAGLGRLAGGGHK